MAEKNLEYEVARALLKRYLAGEQLEEALLDDLERHLRASPTLLAEAQRLRGRGEAIPPTSPLDRLRTLFGGLSKGTAGAPRAFLAPPGADPLAPTLLDVLRTPRNLALSTALAVVLVLMSTALRDPAGLLGAKAATMPSSHERAEDVAPRAPDSAGEPDAGSGRQGAEADPAVEPHAEGTADPTPVEGVDTNPTPETDAPTETAAKGGPPEPARRASVPGGPAKRATPPAQSPKLEGEIVIADSAALPRARSAKAPGNTVRPDTPPRTRRSARKASPSGIRVYDEHGRPKD